jgi:hypothetical protein
MVVHKFADELGLGFEPLVLGVAGGGIRFLSVRAEALWVGLLIGESVCGVVIGPLIAAFSLRGCHDASSIVRCYELINVVTMFEAPRPRYIYFFISVSEQVIYLPRLSRQIVAPLALMFHFIHLPAGIVNLELVYGFSVQPPVL